MDNGLSASDVALLNNDGFGSGNSFLWIFALLILANGGFGWGGNNFANAIGYENLATNADVQRGFDNQNAMANQREILSAVTDGTAQSIAATNQTFHDTLGIIQNRYDELARDVSGLAVGQANLSANQSKCCCDLKQMLLETSAGINAGIAQNKYESALNTASINENVTAQIQSVKDMIAQDKIETLQNQVNALQLAQATSNVVRYPVSTTYAVPSPCFNGCGCGNI